MTDSPCEPETAPLNVVVELVKVAGALRVTSGPVYVCAPDVVIDPAIVISEPFATRDVGADDAPMLAPRLTTPSVVAAMVVSAYEPCTVLAKVKTPPVFWVTLTIPF
jgi:hypothetical protein